jgi:hypothetical protein
MGRVRFARLACSADCVCNCRAACTDARGRRANSLGAAAGDPIFYKGTALLAAVNKLDPLGPRPAAAEGSCWSAAHRRAHGQAPVEHTTIAQGTKSGVGAESSPDTN